MREFGDIQSLIRRVSAIMPSGPLPRIVELKGPEVVAKKITCEPCKGTGLRKGVGPGACVWCRGQGAWLEEVKE